MSLSNTETLTAGIYGHLPNEVIPLPQGARQYSPLILGSYALDECSPKSLASMVMLAPPNTIERRYLIALTLRALAPQGRLTVLALKDKGGLRLKKELIAFGCDVVEDAKRHFRICTVSRPAKLVGVDEAIAAGSQQMIEATGFWSQPGIFSWDRLDPGSALLVSVVPELEGRGADIGSGFGYLARQVLLSQKVKQLILIDLDRRAIKASQRNIEDARASFLWTNVEVPHAELRNLDFVIMNPPFHDAGHEDRSLGQRFIERAHALLRAGGVCWITANRHLPYEESLTQLFKTVTLKAQNQAYKVYEAVK